MATDGSLTPAADFEVAVSGLLSSFGVSASSTATAYSDDVFDKLAKYLTQAGKQQWSLRPRTYLVLRLMNRLDSMDAFILDGLFDIAIPYTYSRLPASLKPGTRNAFLEKQTLVMSKAGDLEMESGRHRHFSSSADTNFVIVKQLGSGYFGVVDHVRSKLSLEEYARKRTLRARTFSKDKKALKIFENELSNLKRLSHGHLVKYVGSYTDPQYIGLLTSPVADCDLKVFLNQTPFPRNLVSLLRSFLGCLCSAVSYLHSQKCRHKDLKPGNILVKNDVVLITDFGTSRNWSDRSKGTTTGESGPYTPGYAAPEVVAWEARNESSDIWSLGCVFLDILSVLKGESLRSKDQFFGENGNGGRNPRVNPHGLDLWLTKLRAVGDEDNQPILWIQQMLQPGPNDRISSVRLLDEILGYVDEYIYYGHCCADQEEDLSSCHSSEFADDVSSVDERGDDSTNSTSAAFPRVDEEDLSGSRVTHDNNKLRLQELSMRENQTSESQTSAVVSTDVALAPSNDSSDRLYSDAQVITDKPIASILDRQDPRDQQSIITLNDTGGSFSTAPESIRQPLSRPELRAHSKTESNVSRNPFRPGYVPLPRNESAPPQATPFSRPAGSNHFSVFFNGLETSHGTKESDNEEYESTIPRSWPPEVEPAPPTTAVHIPEDEPDTTQMNDSIQLSDVYVLFDAAAKGNVADVMRYCLAEKNSSWMNYGRTVFHVAAENHQRTLMQVLIDIGCPVSYSDVADYVLPMVSRREINVDPSMPTHSSVFIQVDAMRTGRSDPADAIGTEHQLTDPFHRIGEVQGLSQSIGNAIKQAPRLVSVWEPAGQHFDLKIHPNPLALHEAVRLGSYWKVLNCLSGETDLNIRDEDDQSPLDLAISLGSISLVRLLVQYGSDLASRNKVGRSAYEDAATRFKAAEFEEVVALSTKYRHITEQRKAAGSDYTSVSRGTWRQFLARIERGEEREEQKEEQKQQKEDDEWLQDWQIAIVSRFHWYLEETTGTLEWYKGPHNIIDAYPGQVFELGTNNMAEPYPRQVFELGRSAKMKEFDFAWPVNPENKSEQKSTPKLLDKLFRWK